MKVTLLLADYAQTAQDQKLHAIGLGWTQTATPLGPHSVVMLFDFDAGESGQNHQFDLRLTDETGNTIADMQGGEINVQGEFHADVDPESPVNTFLPIPMGIAGGLPLKPGAYQWELSVRSQPDQTWTRKFVVVEPPEATSPQ